MVRKFLRRRILLVGFVAVVVPLCVLLGLQYKWLTSLQETSAIAETAWLNNYLEAVGSEIEYFYRTQAERALNVPSYLFSSKHRDKLGPYFRRKAPEGARYLFVAKYVRREEWGQFQIFDPATRTVNPKIDAATFQAINVALSPWRILAYKGSPVPVGAMTVDEMDPDNIIILNPITDDACQLVGMAGMVVDVSYFEGEVLPAAIEKSLPRFFDEKGRENLIITVRDGRDRLIWGAVELGDESEQVVGSIPFIFKDWRLRLGSRYTTPEEWAKSNFLLNISMSAVLGLMLLGGVVLALRTASRELRLSRMKSDFVSNVSHELRTPLASIRVFGEFLRLGRVAEPEKCREYGEFIETESRRLTGLIDNILDFSKIESGAKTYRFESTDLLPIVERTVQSLRVSLRHQGFKLDFRAPSEPLPAVLVDAEAISQALANLIDNAVKYSDGASEIVLRVDRDEESVWISVEDQGIGITSSEQKKIFERFHRVSTGLVHDVKGSGLGLSIVHHVIEAHRGTVEVDSEPGRGSIFKIRLPLGDASVEPLHHLSAAIPSAETAGKA